MSRTHDVDATCPIDRLGQIVLDPSSYTNSTASAGVYDRYSHAKMTAMMPIGQLQTQAASAKLKRYCCLRGEYGSGGSGYNFKYIKNQNV